MPGSDAIRLLLVEDNPADVRLFREAIGSVETHTQLSVAGDGTEALALLRREGEFGDALRPDLILLDLNMPKMGGHEVLAQLHFDRDLRTIPVVVLTTSSDPEDILNAYDLGASSYITKPSSLEDYFRIVYWIERFCLNTAQLPPRAS